MMQSNRNTIDRLLVGLLLAIFSGIVLHAPLTIWLGTFWPDASLVLKAWKEILMGLALIPLGIALYRRQAWGMYRSPLMYLMVGYGLLHAATTPLFFTGAQATMAGLLIDLRYILFFLLMYGAIGLYPAYAALFKKLFFAGVAVVAGFAVLQVTVLPHDVLRHIGYGSSTIAPYLTVDENMDYIRINSTLRGPNPLGAYAVIALAAVVAYWGYAGRRLTGRYHVVLAALTAGLAIALVASYSRSALIAAVVALAVVAGVLWGRRVSRWVWLVVGSGALLLASGLYVFQDTTFVSQVILHEDPSEGNETNSNDGHLDSLVEGVRLILAQPFGAGIGSTGSASLMTDEPQIIENQYLFVAHEVGWAGVVLFLAIYGLLLEQLWRRRQDWMALAVFASGIGLAIIGILLPVWVDDTVAIIWWGLAAVALAPKTRL